MYPCGPQYLLIQPVLLDLLGAVLATAGGGLLAAPTLRDSLTRRRGFGIDIWLSEDAATDGPRKAAEDASIRTAQHNTEKSTRRGHRSDLRMLTAGFYLLVLGLALSIPAKLMALLCA